MRFNNYKCDLCDQVEEQKYLYSIVPTSGDNDSNGIGFTRDLSASDKHICSNCITNIIMADRHGGFT